MKNDPKNYHRLSQPHESLAKANEAVDNFYQKVKEAREQYGIADILVVIKDSAFLENGETGEFIQHSQFGHQLNGVAMAAYAYGKIQAENKEFVSGLLAGK